MTEPTRPKTRGECVNGERPCPWVTCRHHLHVDVTPSTGRLYVHVDPDSNDSGRPSCSLDVAARGGMTLEEVSEVYDLTREAIGRIEKIALRKLARRADMKQLNPNLP